MSDGYCDYLIDLLAPWGTVTARKMFGGYGVYRGDLMFGLVADDTLYFKVDDGNRADYEAAGMEPFTYDAKGKRVTLSYWQVPAEVMDDPDTLAVWAEKAHAAVVRGKTTKKPSSVPHGRQ